jgi:hypothetical protein
MRPTLAFSSSQKNGWCIFELESSDRSLKPAQMQLFAIFLYRFIQ